MKQHQSTMSSLALAAAMLLFLLAAIAFPAGARSWEIPAGLAALALAWLLA